MPTLVIDGKAYFESAALRRLADLVRARPSWRRMYELEGLTDWAA